MQDVNCPYCETRQDINHDDGYGYDEDKLHQQECIECEKTFVFTTSIIFYYEAMKADCLNGARHKFKRTRTCPKRHSKARCKICDLEKPLPAGFGYPGV